jgi:hypothetical protein
MNVKTVKKHVIRRMTLSWSAETNRQALYVFTGASNFDVPRERTQATGGARGGADESRRT